MRIVVIGAGVIGLQCAYELRRRGASVVLVDRSRAGQACSAGNAGWITPALSAPLPAPGLTLKSLGWLLRSESPLYIKPTALPRLLSWLLAFRRYCNTADYESGLRAVAALNEVTLSTYDDLGRDLEPFEMERRGVLFVFRTSREMEHTLADLRGLEPFGYDPARVLSGSELGEREPALAGDMAGGFLMPRERHVRPEKLCAALASRIGEMGVEIKEAVSVGGPVRERGVVRAVATAAGPVEGDAFVIAAGAWSGELASRFGARLPVQAGKGYSITVRHPPMQLSQPLYLAEAKIGVTPFEGALRLAGTMELSGLNLRLDNKRIAALERSAAAFLPNALSGSERTDWVGMRPITPDGLPIIGPLPSVPNVHVATGHAMLGVTLAPATAVLLADLILEGRSGIDRKPFDPGRF